MFPCVSPWESCGATSQNTPPATGHFLSARTIAASQLLHRPSPRRCTIVGRHSFRSTTNCQASKSKMDQLAVFWWHFDSFRKSAITNEHSVMLARTPVAGSIVGGMRMPQPPTIVAEWPCLIRRRVVVMKLAPHGLAPRFLGVPALAIRSSSPASENEDTLDSHVGLPRDWLPPSLACNLCRPPPHRVPSGSFPREATSAGRSKGSGVFFLTEKAR